MLLRGRCTIYLSSRVELFPLALSTFVFIQRCSFIDVQIAPWQYERACSADRRNQEVSQFLEFTVEYLNQNFPPGSRGSQYSRSNGCPPPTILARKSGTPSLGATEKDLPTKEILIGSVVNVISEIRGPKSVYCSINHMLAFLNGMASNMDERLIWIL